MIWWSNKNFKQNGTFKNCSSNTKKKSNKIIPLEILKRKLTEVDKNLKFENLDAIR